MKAKNVMDALNDVDFDMVDQAIEEREAKKQSWIKWVAAAACAVLVLGVGAFVLFGQQNRKPDDPSGGRLATDGRYLIPEHGAPAILWAWEYLTPMERYEAMTLGGTPYHTRAREIREELLAESLGVCETEGYDPFTETRYPAEFEVRAIRGVDPTQLVAVDLEGTWVVFVKGLLGEFPVPKTLGELMDTCSLPETLSLERFCTKDGYETTGWYLAESDENVWQILSECREVPCSVSDAWNLADQKYISFTATSEALGVYKQVLSITEDGYLLTNLMEYGYVFEIGEDAAGRIIQAVTEHCRETEMEPYYPMIAGTLTEIGDGYILVDNSPLCVNEADGLVYKVLLDDLRARRCLEFPGDITLGDCVVIEYSGTIDAAHENTVTGAFSISEAIFAENGAQIPENGAEASEETVVVVTSSNE